MYRSKLKLNYIPEFSAYLFGRKRPSMVSVNLTDKCNQKCIYCEIGQGHCFPEIRRLTKNDLLWIIDQMEILGIKQLSMCGGEPFLFPDITELIYYAWKKKIRCNITSNGMTIHNLDQSQLDLLFHCDTQINISIDSFNNEIQSLTRGCRSALKNAIKSVQVLRNNKINVTLLCTISRYNCQDLLETFISAYELGVEEVLFQPVISYSNYPEMQAIDRKHLINVEKKQIDMLSNQLEKIYRFEKRHKINSNVYRLKPWIIDYIESFVGGNNTRFFEKVLKKFYCRESHAVIDINFYGGIQPCGLALAKTNIKDDKHTDLFTQWTKATSGLKNDISNQNYPDFCDGCCHKFSRNMLASIMKYPIVNRKALYSLSILLLTRLLIRIYKKIIPGLR